MRRVRSAIITIGILGTLGTPLPGAAQACPETPTYDPAITPPSAAILGFPDRPATTPEINAYVEQLGEESDRVLSGIFGSSTNGTPLAFSLVSTPGRQERLDAIASRQSRLRDPRRTSADRAAEIARQAPAIAWYAGSVHGNETSGADAAIQILYELAARTDCEALGMLKELVVGIMPLQNPDGRDTASRANPYGFDLNRDWFAWTQAETDEKIDLLHRFPPVLFVDAHEMANSSYFFPPNADPVYHEISQQAMGWINGIYGPALAAAFEARQETDPLNWDYFNYDIFDLFYMGYGDSVPTTAFTAAGMTFEKGIADTPRQRWEEQFVAGWTALREAAANKERILSDYYAAHRRALRDGRRGRLEPNKVYAPGSTLERQVPPLRVRHYFVNPKIARPDVARLLDRLLRMDVEVYRLREPLDVGRLRRYGHRPTRETLGRGWLWIPMAQPQKRWVQAMLHEDTYVPFPYFYDVTAWSNPLLMNLDARFTGVRLRPEAARVRRAPGARIPLRLGKGSEVWFAGDSARAVAAAWQVRREGLRIRRLEPGEHVWAGSARRFSLSRVPPSLPGGAFVVRLRERSERAVLRRAAEDFRVRMRRAFYPAPRGRAFRQPRVALFRSGAGGESLNHLRFTLERAWKLPFDELTAAQIAGGQLAAYDVLVVPGTNTTDLDPAEGTIREWVNQGGVYVGTARGGSGGTEYAVQHGYTSSSLSDPAELQVPGTMFRVRIDRDDAVAAGGQTTAYWYHLGELVLGRSSTGVNVGRYPRREPVAFSSGYAQGEDALGGSAALVRERIGEGHVVLFSGEPNFRAFTDGPGFFLANALGLGGWQPRTGSATRVDDPAARRAVAAAQASADLVDDFGPGRRIRIEVPAGLADEALAALAPLTTDVEVRTAGGSAFLEIRNDRGLPVDEHPFARELLPALRDAGIEVRSAVL